jgi:hypothetical protein
MLVVFGVPVAMPGRGTAAAAVVSSLAVLKLGGHNLN